MQVHLEAIKFNYDENLSRTGAFYIRRNETQTVRIPEWQPDGGGSHECSPVAYSMSNLPAMMTIQASFRSTGGPQTVLVRAQAESAGHVLGDVQQESIPGNGSSGLITFNMPGARAMVLQSGIGFYDIVWRWQFSDFPSSWTTVQITRHRVYVVLGRPTCPWQPEDKDSSNTHQPWTEVLDHACQWAASVRADPDDVARLVTERVSGLGNHLVEHATGASYAHASFKCTEFLELLNNGAGERTLNCDDCATIVSTFANILGSSLWQSSMGPTFNTNHIVQIGDTHWDPTQFIHHSVAWKNECLVNDVLYDAYLQVDGEGRPDLPPRVALQPSGDIFGLPADMAYSYRLVHPDSFCQPTPNGLYPRQRRLLGYSYLGAAKIPNEEVRNILKEVYKFDTWPPVPTELDAVQRDSLALEPLINSGSFAKWQLQSFERISDEQFKNVFQLLFKDEQARLLSLKIYECIESTQVNDSFLQILAVFNQTLDRFEGLGEIAFVERSGEDSVMLVFRRGLFIGMVASSGKQKLDVLEFARALDSFLGGVEAVQLSSLENEAEISQTIPSSEANLMENKMTHRLAGIWRNFGFNLEVTPPRIQRDGEMDLRTLDDNGILERGYVGAQPKPIKGKINDVGNITKVRFERTDAQANGARYEGFLIVDDATGKMTIIGKLVTNQAALASGQTEEPWVITKP